jgi:regulator of RNase E activity RraA
MSPLPINLASRLSALDAASIADAAKTVAPGAVKSLAPSLLPRHTMGVGTKLFGRALTVHCDGDDFHAMVQALKTAPPAGTVLVVRGPSILACAGELFAAECKRLELGGLVVDGCVRDTQSIRKLDFPVYSRGVNPAAGSNEREGVLGTPLLIDNGDDEVLVRTGDILAGDDDGCIVVSLLALKDLNSAAAAAAASAHTRAPALPKSNLPPELEHGNDRNEPVSSGSSGPMEEEVEEEVRLVCMMGALLDEAEAIQARERKVLDAVLGGKPLLHCL